MNSRQRRALLWRAAAVHGVDDSDIGNTLIAFRENVRRHGADDGTNQAVARHLMRRIAALNASCPGRSPIPIPDDVREIAVGGSTPLVVEIDDVPEWEWAKSDALRLLDQIDEAHPQ